MDQIVYADCLENQHLTYSKEGWKAKRLFKINLADNSVPTSTLYTAYMSGSLTPTAMGLPTRGAPHPSIVIQSNVASGTSWSDYYFNSGLTDNNAFCADIFDLADITSPNQIVISVEYSIFNAEVQEPTEAGDTAPADLEISSSVQQIETAFDFAGNALVLPYTATTNSQGAWAINNGNVSTPLPYSATTLVSAKGFQPGSPNVPITVKTQTPNTVFRFKRREQLPRSPNGLVGFLNAPTTPAEDPNYPNWTINGIPYEPYSLLMTRCDSQSFDNQQSFVITYELQYGKPVPIGNSLDKSGQAQLVPPAALSYTSGGTPYVSPWLAGAYYLVPTGYEGTSTTAVPATIGQSQIPPDAIPYLFAVNGYADFLGELSLNYPNVGGMAP